MTDSFGLFVSNEEKSVLSAQPFDLSFSSDSNMLKIKKEIYAGIGETLNFDHGLGYFPFFLSFIRDFNNTIANGKTPIAHTGGNNSVGTWSGTIKSDGWLFICHNPGAA